VSRALLYVTMRPPHIAPAIAFSPGRLLVAAILLALVGLLAVLVVTRRVGAARRIADEPLKRLNGFHIFGPDEDDEPLIHVPLLRGRRAEHLPREGANGHAHASGRPPAPSPNAARPGRLPLPAAHRSATAPSNGTSTARAAQATSQPAADPPARRPAATSARAAAPGRTASARPALAVPPPPSASAAAAKPAPRAAAKVAVPLADPPAARPRRATASTPLPSLSWNSATPVTASAGGPPPRRPRSDDRELLGTAAPKPAAAARPAPRQEGIRSGDILLVEDDVTIAGMYQVLLRTRGYDSRHALDGVEGIAMVRAERPALILLDMMMPRMDGIQFLEALRGWPRSADIPVVVLSNVGDRPLVERALALGAVEYLVKAQTRPQVLLGALPHWLRGNRALTTLS